MLISVLNALVTTAEVKELKSVTFSNPPSLLTASAARQMLAAFHSVSLLTISSIYFLLILGPAAIKLMVFVGSLALAPGHVVL